MNKLIVIGHEFSQPQDIFKILTERGVNQAKVSYRDSLSPIEINKILVDIGSIDLNSDFLNVDPIWNSLYLDLFLANINNSIWGWADSAMLKLLNYYNSLDSKTYFILSYTHPCNLNFDNRVSVDELKFYIDRSLKEWYDYNSLLFKFYEENRQKCILVNSEQVFKSINNYLLKIESYIHCKFNENLIDLVTDKKNNIINKKSDTIEQLYKNDSNINHYIVNMFIKKNEKYSNLYETLQKNADLPNVKNYTMVDELDVFLKFYDVQRSYMHENQELKCKLNYMEEQYDKSLMQIRQLDNYKKQNFKLNKQFQDLSLKLEIYSEKSINEKTLKNEINIKNQFIENIKQEKEKLYREVSLYKNNSEKSQDALTQKNSELAHANNKSKNLEISLSKINNDLLLEKQRTEELEKSISRLKINVELDKESIKIENKLLNQQISKLQEEIERYYIENQLAIKGKGADSEDNVLFYGAAERVKSELPYVLGTKIIENSKNWKSMLSLPMTLYKDLPALRKMAKENQNLPPIDQYVDTQQAEKVKQHLSYKIGKVLVDASENPSHILTLPFKLRKEYMNFSLNKRKNN